MANNAVFYTLNIDGNANANLQQLQRSFQSVREVADKLKSSWSKMAQVAVGLSSGMDVASRVLGSVKNAIGSVMDAGMENELQRIDMTTLFKGNAEAADDAFRQISKYATQTVYDKTGLIDAQKTMMSFGIEGKKAFGTLKQIGDIAMGDSQKMQSLALAFSQATSAGKLQGQDLMQLINAGFNPLQVISEKTGKSMTKLKDDMSKGKISADMLAQAFQWATEEGGLFYQGAQKAGESTAGRLNQLKDTANEMLIKTFQKIKPVTDAVLDFATNALSAIPGKIRLITNAVKSAYAWVDRWSPLLTSLAALIGTVTVAMNLNRMVSMGLMALQGAMAVKTALVTGLTNAWAGAQALLNAVMSMNPIGLVVAAVAALAAGIAVCWKKFDTFRAAVKTAWDTVKQFGEVLKTFVLDRVKGIIEGLGAMGKAIAKLFGGDFKGAFAAAKDGIGKMTGVEAVKKAVETSKSIANGIGANYDRRLQQERNASAKEGKKGKEGVAPGMTANTNAKLVNSTASLMAENKAGAGKIESDIKGGGQKTVNINLGKFFDSINFNTTTMSESVGNLEQTVMECLSRVLANGAMV